MRQIATNRPAKIVIVEDSEPIYLVLTSFLKSFGHHVVAIKNDALSGVEAVLQSKPDLVFMDVYLEGDLTGIDAAKRIHEQSSIPIVFMTSSEDPETFQKLREVESYACIPKPFTQMEIWFVIENVMHLHETKNALECSQKALKKQLSIEAFASNISNRFIDHDFFEFPYYLNLTLHDMADFVQCDACFIILKNAGQTHFDIPYKYQHNDQEEWDNPFSDPIDHYPWLTSQFEKDDSVFIESPDALPAMASNEKKWFHQLSIHAFIVMPVRMNGKPEGLIMLASQKKDQQLSIDSHHMVKKIAYIISNALSRHKAEMDRKEYQIQLQQILDAIQSPISVKDVHQKIIYVNKAFCELAGEPRAQIINKTIDPLFQNEEMSLKSTKEYLGLSLDETSIIDIQSPNDANLRTFNLRNTQFQNYSGEQFYLSVAHEISALKKAEEMLLFTQHAVDNSNIGIMWVDSEGTIIYVNQTLCRYCNYSKKELLYQSLTIINPNIEKRGFSSYWNDIQIFGSKTFRTSYQKKSKEMIPVEVLVSYLEHKGQSYLCYFIRDITLRKQAEEGIQIFKNIFDHANFGMCVFDSDQSVIYLNDYMAMVHGYSQEDIVLKTYHIFHNVEEIDTIKPLYEDLFNKHIEFINHEINHSHRNGKIFPMLMSGKCIQSADGEVIYFSVSAVDISELAVAKNDLKELNDQLIGLNTNLEKQVEQRTQSLRQSEALYRLLVENQTELLVQFNEAYDILFASPSYCRYFDKSESFLQCIYPQDISPLKTQLDDMFCTQKPSIMEIRANINDRWRWFSWSFNVAQNNTNKRAVIVAVGRDITTQKSIEKKIDFQNIILKSQQEASMDGILFINANGDIQSYNQRLLEMWSIPLNVLEENIIQNTIDKNIPLTLNDMIENISLRPLLKSAIEKIIDPGLFLAQVKYLFENRNIKSRAEIHLTDGRCFDRYTSPLIGENGKFYGRAWYFRDITEQKRAETKILNQKRFIENIMQSMIDLFIVMDLKSNIMTINDATLTLTGYSENELRNQSFGILLEDSHQNPDQYRKKIPEIIQTIIKEKFIQNYDTNFYTKKEETIPVSITGYVVSDTQDKEHSIVVIARDTREIREATAKLVQTEKLVALGEMSAGVAHELKQPLNVIKIISQSIMRDVHKKRLDVSEIPDNLQQVTTQVNKMSEIIDHLRIFSRRSDNVHHEGLNINDIINNAFSLFMEQFRIRGIAIKKQLDRHIPEINGDPIRLEQVFTNLISNARKACEDSESEEKTVTVISSKEIIKMKDHQVDVIVIQISDTGPGVSEKHIAKIFDHFFTTKSPGEGTGLGLAISKTIIEEHHGIIEYLPDVSIGATFRITLPINGKLMIDDIIT
jgi:PAS domain S-box-containing protein